MSRNAYLLTCDMNSERSQFSKNVLEKIGFNVIFFQAIPHTKSLLSNRQSMIEIYKLISNDENNNWSYVFEDDINILEDIKINEIIEYEKISNDMFYLGLCKYGNNTIIETEHIINNHKVYSVSGCVRGIHALAFSRQGATNFLKFISNFTIEYIDMILELYTLNNRANVVRIDLESNIKGHLGIIFQDRERFQSIIGT
jgi:hypothetical protein